MTAPRYPFPAATPSHDSAPIAERPPCHGRWDVYDALVDVGGTGRSVDPEAVEAARNMCATCLLRMPEVHDRCHRDAIANNERWIGVVLNTDVRNPPTLRRTCGKPHGSDAHSKHHERPCDACRKAAARRTAERKRAKRNEGVVVRNVDRPRMEQAS